MTRQTFKSQYGRKGISVSALCPTYVITRRLGRTHVSTPNAEIAEMIRTGVSVQRDSGNDSWTDALEREAIRFALWRHAENRASYVFVMGGEALSNTDWLRQGVERFGHCSS